MSETALLVAELQSKLAELNAKIATLQQDMLRHFEDDMGICLENCPDHVSSEVRRIIAASMSNYPALCPTHGSSGIQSPPPDRVDVVQAPPQRGWTGSQSPPPSGVFKEGPHTLHQREKDLEGVFTPGYLPLLGDSHRPQQSSYGLVSPATSATTAPGPSPALSVKEGKQSVPTTPIDVPAPDLPGRPTMRSVSSSSTPPSTRRSALRRSDSGSMKDASPRHVRFSHEGEEVLPTASPPKSTPISIPRSLRATQADDEYLEVQAVDDEACDELSPYDASGEEDTVPMKKMTTTQMLQVFTRMPGEGGHVKEVPGGDAGGPLGYLVSVDGETHTLRAPEPGSDLMAADRTDLTLKKPVEELWERAKDQPLDEDIMLASLRSRNKAFKAGHDGSLDLQDETGPSNTKPSLDNEREEESDESFVEMRSLSRSPKERIGAVRGSPAGNGLLTGATISSSSPSGTATGNGSLKRTTSNDGPLKRTTSMGSLVDLQSRNGPSKQKSSPAEDADPVFDLSDDEDDQDEDKYLPGNGDDDHVPLSTKNSLRKAATGTAGKPVLITSTSPSAALFSPVAGSYLGNSFSMTPIRNAQLYDEIAAMKDVHSFIGSIDGRTGLDSANPGSYRATLAKSIGGDPKSLTERLALEEAMGRRENEGAEETGGVEELDKLE